MLNVTKEMERKIQESLIDQTKTIKQDCSEIFTSAGTIGELSFMKEAKNFGQAERRCNELDSNLVEFWYEHEYDQVIPGAIVR